MMRAIYLACALASLAWGGCALPPEPARFDYDYPPLPTKAQVGASLWPQARSSQLAASLISDPIARSRGDIITILIRENQRVQQRESTDVSQRTGVSLELAALTGLPNAFRANGLPGGQASSERDFSAKGTVSKEGRFEARVTAIVTDVLPNGNLVLEGRRRVEIDNETKNICVRGVARPCDISPGNTIQSELLAAAQVSYEGDGPLTRATQRGIVGTVADFLWHHLWPF
ncbi:MAG: flagellar basal body L-ring protein FlgH [Planctomycetes bacterium]|nr:flagellar basal body L-ring protein FlgH [Planctomycetota bacterium]